MASERWIAVKPGWQAGREPVRSAQYCRETGLDSSRITLIVTYQIGGFLAFPEIGAPDAFMIGLQFVRTISQPGAPSLPEDVFSVALPRRAAIDFDQVKCEVVSRWEAPERLRVAPVPLPFLEGDTPEAYPDPEIYQSDREFPKTIATCGPPSSIDGMTRTVVAVYPVTYQPLTRRLWLRSEIKVSIPCLVRAGSCYTGDNVDWGSPMVRNMVGSGDWLLRTPFSER